MSFFVLIGMHPDCINQRTCIKMYTSLCQLISLIGITPRLYHICKKTRVLERKKNINSFVYLYAIPLVYVFTRICTKYPNQNTKHGELIWKKKTQSFHKKLLKRISIRNSEKTVWMYYARMYERLGTQRKKS